MSQATSWNSELPSGHNPFWIKDESLLDLGLRPGDAVGVDTRREPAVGDLVLVEVETDELADRLARRWAETRPDGAVVLIAANEAVPPLEVGAEAHMMLGVIVSRLRFEPGSGEALRVVEEALEA
jgi:SOS-response transcriptional repressor LexA